MIYLLTVCSALIALFLGYTQSWIVTPLIIGLTYGIASLGVSVLVRAGQVSFGHAMYACIAAYSVAFITRAYPSLDIALVLVISIFLTVIIGAIIGLFVIRYRSIFFGMLNLALSMVLFALLTKMYTVTGGTDGLRIKRSIIFGMSLSRAEYEFLLLCITVFGAVFLAWIVQKYYRSANGEMLAAIKTNETRLEYLGVSAYFVMWKAYLISVALAGFAGTMLGLIQGLVTPEMGEWIRSGEYVFISILGGAVHVSGAFIGAGIFEIVKLVSSAYFPGLWQLILGTTLIVVIFIMPDGIVGTLAKKHKNRQHLKE